MANLITLGRVVLLFATIGLIYLRQPWSVLLATFLTVVVFVSDALDGYVARRRGGGSDMAGTVFDIAGDRVVENVYWVVCAHLNLIPVWAPLVMLVRSFAVDAMRSLALAQGKTAFGKATMMESRLGLWLAASRFHRGLYGVAKVVAFVYLIGEYGLRLWAEQDPPLFASWDPAWPILGLVGQVLAYFAVLYGLARGAVVIYDARGYYLPSQKGTS